MMNEPLRRRVALVGWLGAVIALLLVGVCAFNVPTAAAQPPAAVPCAATIVAAFGPVRCVSL